MKTTEPFPDSEPETTPTPPTRVRTTCARSAVLRRFILDIMLGWRNKRYASQVTRWIGVALAASYGLLILTLWPGSWGWWL